MPLINEFRAYAYVYIVYMYIQWLVWIGCLKILILKIFLDHLKDKTEVQSSKPPESLKKRCAKRKRNDETECSNMAWTTSELKCTTPSENGQLTNSDYKLQQNAGQPKKVKYISNETDSILSWYIL